MIEDFYVLNIQKYLF